MKNYVINKRKIEDNKIPKITKNFGLIQVDTDDIETWVIDRRHGPFFV